MKGEETYSDKAFSDYTVKELRSFTFSHLFRLFSAELKKTYTKKSTKQEQTVSVKEKSQRKKNSIIQAVKRIVNPFPNATKPILAENAVVTSKIKQPKAVKKKTKSAKRKKKSAK